MQERKYRVTGIPDCSDVVDVAYTPSSAAVASACFAWPYFVRVASLARRPGAYASTIMSCSESGGRFHPEHDAVVRAMTPLFLDDLCSLAERTTTCAVVRGTPTPDTYRYWRHSQPLRHRGRRCLACIACRSIDGWGRYHRDVVGNVETNELASSVHALAVI